MRGDDEQQTAMFSYLTLAQRIPADHPARQIRALVDRALERMDTEFEKLYSDAIWDVTVFTKNRERLIAGAISQQLLESVLVEALRQREIAPHVSEYTTGQNMAKNSLTEAERNDERRVISQRKRKLVEKVFGWSKADSVLRQVKVRGLERVDWFYRMTVVGYDLVRMRRLIPIEALAQ